MSDRPTISVIMPVYNGRAFIARSLSPLLDMLHRGELLEVIVVDDTSTDDTAVMAEAMGARVMPSGGRLGPGGARNEAAAQAKGDILWFVDADVIVHDDAARELQRAFAEPGVTAVFGSYDDQPPAKNFLSQYKNLVHHFYHHRGHRDASTFWAGCGGVRKEAFLAVDGFDVVRYTRPSIEDIELGYRLRAAGGRIVLWPALQGTHLKVWRFFNLIHTEVFCRAIPWSRLMLSQTGLVNDLNVGTGERMRAVVAGIFFVGTAASLHPAVPGWVALASFGAIALANGSLLRLFYRRKGPVFALGALLFHQVYYLYSSAAFAWCWLEYRITKMTRAG
ncbi:MAG: glycosyltransferase [Gammaproteobacteria bacterium]|nr:glycosyltransferase [Gammaproteobacteria bacterium]MDH3410921.1 glycosyltransferase [Gammaproteobacteria bacterium]